jgi:hypothetical protein
MIFSLFFYRSYSTSTIDIVYMDNSSVQFNKEISENEHIPMIEQIGLEQSIIQKNV